MDSKFTSNPNFVWGIRKKWSHDDLLTPRFQNGSCLQKTTVNIDKERKRDPMVNSLQN